MPLNMDFKRTASTPDIYNRPLPALPPWASPPRPRSERSHAISLLTRSTSVNSEDTLWTATSSSSSGSTWLKRRPWGRNNSFTFGRKNKRHSRQSSLTDETATVVSFGEVESLFDGSSAENGSGETSSVMSEQDCRNFQDLNRTVERYGMPHHPFSAEDAPYIQSYSPTALDSDYHTFELLRRLNTNSNSPTFHEYGRRPPTNVLDLGCGEGHWVLFAARAWKSAGTHVTGLDLIDLYNNDHGRVSRDREAEVPPRNVTFVRSNFLKYRLPFHNNSFDLVRMANLALVVPYWTWDFVLSEITRVLCPGGRLELVDDQLFFPRIPSIEELRGYQIPSPIDPDLSPNLWQDLINARHDAQAVRKIWETQPSSAPNTTNRPHSPGKGHKRSQSEADYEASARVAGQLEDTFMCMLVRKYQYGTRTYEYIILALEHYFSQAKMAHEFRLGVPSREFVERSEARESAKRPTRRPRYSEGDIPIPTSSPRIRSFDSTATSKALRVLVGDAESSRPPKPPQPYQPPGLILLPTSLNKLLPFSPAELEMHACKNMHTLLSCKNALTKHIKEQTDKDGEPLFSEDEVNDYLFDYDQFRRKRFNWPMDYPGLRMDEDPVESSPRTPLLRLGSTSSSFQGRDRSSSNPLSPRKLKTKTERAIEVRVVRVYHAIKAADGSSTMSLV